MSYRNLVKDAWDVTGHKELKYDADRAKEEAVADIFRWRKAVDLTRKKLNVLVNKERKKK